MILSGISTSAADTLVVSLQVSNYNGYQVSCFGSKDGWIDLSVSGGQPPYHYEWSNGSNDQDLTELAAGYYKVDVLDNDGQRVTKEVTLDQPLAMKLDVDVYEYSNGYNISCYQCSNGNASVVVLGGAPPFTITWSDGPIGADRYNLAAKDYKITAADANGCAGTSTTIYLRGPDRSDWSMSGNPGTTPGPQYIGTPDNKDVVLKSNGQERLRIMSNGGIGLWGADTTTGPLYRDYDGTLKMGVGPDLPVWPPSKCFLMSSRPFWLTIGNDFTHLCPNEPRPVLGTLSNMDLNIVTNGEQRMRITRNGAVGIGTNPPSGAVGDYRLFVEDGIVCRDVLVKMGDWPDYVFQPNYALMPMDAMRQYLRINKHLPGIPSAAELEAKQGVEVGDLQARMLKVVEEQALYILQLEERQTQLEQRLKALETAQHR
ncbi:MAG: SprB repeat-containing protein [Flavobacteriales bacterium]|jgi:hypothetical protein|nr:SprB repeat-containing protein [Flavobacteriales bacterium]